MSQALQNTLTIQTPEGIRFHYHLASPVSRFLAWWIDAMIVAVLMTAVQSVLAVLAPLSTDIYQALLILIYFVLSIGYGIAMEWLRQGQTIGKRLLHLRVIDASGLKLQGVQVVIRNLLRFVDALPLFYAVGGIVSLLHRQAQRLGDIAGNTVVIRTPQVNVARIEDIGIGKYNSFRDHPHLAARLRQHVSQDLAYVALRALLRREQLDAEARVDLFDEIAAHFKTHATFPATAQIGLTAEHYVRNCVEILFEKTLPDKHSLRKHG
jgi:uncharacterized RDD family membrane protein YckC